MCLQIVPCILCVMYTQVKEMVNLNLFIDSHYKYIVSIIRVKHILTLHLSTANWRILLTTGCCCKNMVCYVILPGRVNTTVTQVVACIQCTFEWDLILLYFKEMLPRMVSGFGWISHEICQISWNLPDFMKSGGFHVDFMLNRKMHTAVLYLHILLF